MSNRPDPQTSSEGMQHPRRRGPGPFTLMVLPALVAASGVAGFLVLTGGLDPGEPQGATARPTGASEVNASYGPWLRKAAGACAVLTPSVLAAQIDQLSGWHNDSEEQGRAGIADFTDAGWHRWGKDEDGNGRSSPLDEPDAIMALGRQDCSLAAKVTELRTEGTVSGDLVDLTLAAYAVGEDAVASAGRVPARARTYLGEVKSRLAGYEGLDHEETGDGTEQSAGAVLSPPVSTRTVTSPFGSRKHPLTGVTKLHTGVDFGAAQGAQVSAARQGQVVFAAFTKAYGNRVVIDHGAIGGKRLQTTYSHLSALQVTAGRAVRTGTPVGRVGSTGLSTGPHLHFEVIYGGYYTDPVPWLAPGH